MTPDPGDRLIFLHTPKTAGVSMREMLSRQYRHLPTFIRGSPEHRDLYRMRRRDREAYRVVGGHYRFGLHLLFDSPSRYMTLLRDPVERTISHFAYIRWQPLHEWHTYINSAQVTLEQWVRLGVADAMDNMQVRRLTVRPGEDVPFRETTRQMLNEAKRILAERVDFVGLTERYEDSIRLFARQLEWAEPFAVERLNASPNRDAAAELPPTTREAILEHTALDLELYAFAVELFERRLAAAAPAAPPRAPGLITRIAGQVRALRRTGDE